MRIEINSWMDNLRIDTEKLLEKFFKGHFFSVNLNYPKLPTCEIFGIEHENSEQIDLKDWIKNNDPLARILGFGFSDGFGDSDFIWKSRENRRNSNSANKVLLTHESFNAKKTNSSPLRIYWGLFRNWVLLLAIAEYLKLAGKEINSLRKFIYNRLHKKSAPFINKRLTEFKKILREQLVIDRLKADLKGGGDFLDTHFDADSDLASLKYPKNSEFTLLKNLVNFIERHLDHLTVQLDLANKSFSDYIALLQLQNSFRFQRIALYVGITALIISVLGIIFG